MDLVTVFEMQRDLAKRHEVPLDLIQRIKDEIDSDNWAGKPNRLVELRQELAKWHENIAKACLMESSELLDWAPWKHWSKKSGNKLVSEEQLYCDDHIKEIRIEIVDLLHFLVEIALLFGMSANDLVNDYMAKNAVNHERKDDPTY